MDPGTTDERGRGQARDLAVLAPWIVGNLLVLILVGRDIAAFDHGLVEGGAYWGRDFINLWTAGRAVIEGQWARLYDLSDYVAYQRQLFGPVAAHNYSYPPLTLPLTVPFALLPYPVALATWLGATGWLFVVAARPWWTRATRLPVWLLLLTPAGTINLWAGHYGFLLAALFIGGWTALEGDRSRRAGLLFGLMCVKPHLAVLVPLILAVRGEWRTIAVAALTVGILVAISVLLFGTEPWQTYLRVTLTAQAALIDAGGGFFGHMSTSTATALIALGVPPRLAGAIQGVQAVMAIALVVAAARRTELQALALIAATATFLVLPYAFNYDLTVVAMAAAMVLLRSGATAFGKRVAMLGLMAPQLGMAMSAFGLPAMPLFLIALLAVQWRTRQTAATGVASSHSGDLPETSAAPNPAPDRIAAMAAGQATT